MSVFAVNWSGVPQLSTRSHDRTTINFILALTAEMYISLSDFPSETQDLCSYLTCDWCNKCAIKNGGRSTKSWPIWQLAEERRNDHRKIKVSHKYTVNKCRNVSDLSLWATQRHIALLYARNTCMHFSYMSHEGTKNHFVWPKLESLLPISRKEIDKTGKFL